MTRYARQILVLIEEAGEHFTAEQIYLRLKAVCPEVALATVYNNLNRLTAQGKIRRISAEGFPDRYDKTLRHDHLLCAKCGSLTDVFLPDLTAVLQAQVPEEILSYDLKIRVLCPACRNAAQNTTES